MNFTLLGRVSPYSLLVLTALFWGGNFNVARAIIDVVPPMGLSFWRWFVAFLLILPFTLKPMKKRWRNFCQNWLLVVLLSLFGVACYNSFVYLGLKTTTAINGAMMQSINPVMTMFLSVLLLKEAITKKQCLAVIISLFGVLIIISRGHLDNLLSLDLEAGDFIVLIAVISWGLYTVLLRRLPDTLKGLPILGYTVCIGTAIIFPFYLFETAQGQPMPLNIESVFGVLYTGVFASVLAFCFWNHATSVIGASRTAQFTHLVPIFGMLIAILILDEKIYSYHIVGMMLVIVGMVIANINYPNLCCR